MMQRLVDSVLGVAKESLKTFSQESFNNVVKLINGFSAIVLAVLPGKASALEGVTGWELHPTFRAPGIPRWMEERVSSFNQFIHDFDFDSTESDEESEYATDMEEDDSSIPSSPSSQTSRVSRSSNFSRFGHDRRGSWIKRLIRKLTWPLRWILGMTPGLRRQSSSGNFTSKVHNGNMPRRTSSSERLKTMYSLASKHFNGVKENLAHRTTDSRRRGVIEDLQLGVELFIERVFEVMRHCIYCVLSPFQTFKSILRKIFLSNSSKIDKNSEVVNKATLGDSDPSLKLEQRKRRHTLNTDARTCGDFITALGYPYESLKVTTGDGYVIAMERIPRPDSKKVLYLQHGILDSSLGWVSNGVVGSQAFAAYDQGYDVFLGNFRGLVSREHVNKNISSQRYWRYSVNEHGTQDIPAMLDKVHEIKMNELKHLHLLSEEEIASSSGSGLTENLPYSLCGVSHSLGGAAMIIYLVTRRLEGKPHYMKRAILLSPAGFHEKAPPICMIMQYVFPLLEPFLRPIVPGLYIPTKFFRMVFNKLSRDFQNYPALGGLVQTLMSYAVGGDTSNWVGALGMTHYNMEDMPGIAYGVALHLAQMMRSKHFNLFDFGEAGNLKAYGSKKPLDIGANYDQIDIPIDVVAGRKDKLIPKSMILKHYQTLKSAGCKASYSEFDYAHLDFTFSHREEVLAYVMSRLLLVQPRASRRRLRRLDTRRSKSVKDSSWRSEMKSIDDESHSRSKSMNDRRHRSFKSVEQSRERDD
ncbi:lysosomal acid lipase/cholesteryl ester hydrolase [Marchantia polymorpha subsp. ruderalis]|uniref:Partial AB-hydrolase lipase domain-containing protein n=2 Tax=Marchantia polymorpha TaxID=3197 RepID=A0AAF6B190_MARPO|nr:hypothetical protein MARPO_0004s0087 [Marchantia polymorpha]PTQ48805.1 hypothetical protein MARPO_0004s0087 [Marchantia polymorpha]BBN05774.1 hypothetical protein Mp_3g15850 [Marchantia polymorpha subsp. ruderalis]BBN05775.1 hypothetical protein Mp_3g15850 [Marchantia polymorpha subsp. ruderalis]|eukprot:PTQ48804.1 hypothetical protein MARPO_0004s0087 [Marchantia polymorpha]